MVNKKNFYYNMLDDCWQEKECEQNIEYRLKQLNINDDYYSYVFLPVVWSIELLPNRIVELILHVDEIRIENNEITAINEREWTIDCDFDNSNVKGWPMSLIRNTRRYWRNAFVCGSNITFPQLLAAAHADIPVEVTEIALEYLKDLAFDKFGFRPSYLGNTHGLMHVIAFCESPLDPNIYLLKDLIGQEYYNYIMSLKLFDNYKELCKYLEIDNPPPSLRKSYTFYPECIIIYIFLRQCGFRDINIIRRFFYCENIFGYNLLDFRYNPVSGLLFLNRMGDYTLSNFQRFSHWLLRHRTEKDLAPRFVRWFNESLNNTAADILRMFVDAELDENEALVNRTIIRRLLTDGLTQDVHDALMNELLVVQPNAVDILHRREKEEYKNVIYQYNDKELALESYTNEYRFILPKDRDELRNWGNLFHNCVASYNHDIEKKLSVIVAMKSQEKFVACIEIKQKRIVQALGYCNQKLPINIRKIIKNWANHNNIYYGGCPYQ